MTPEVEEALWQEEKRRFKADMVDLAGSVVSGVLFGAAVFGLAFLWYWGIFSLIEHICPGTWR